MKLVSIKNWQTVVGGISWLSMDTKKIRIVLRDQLARQGISYSEAALELGISLPTFKRWMTNAQLSIDDLDAILKLLQMSWKDLVNLSEEAEISRKALTPQQEEFLVRHPKTTYFFLQMFIGYPVTSIKKDLQLTSEQVEMNLHLLHKHKMIEYVRGSHLRILVRGPFKWKANGSFSKVYFEKAARVADEYFLNKHDGFATDFEPQSDLHKIFEMYLSKKSLVKFKADIWEVFERYNEKGRNERMYHSIDDMVPVTTKLMISELNLWRRVMWD